MGVLSEIALLTSTASSLAACILTVLKINAERGSRSRGKRDRARDPSVADGHDPSVSADPMHASGSDEWERFASHAVDACFVRSSVEHRHDQARILPEPHHLR